MSFDKIKIISTRLKYGVSPSPADEVEQHVTIWSNGEVKISRYVFGDIRSGYVKAWSDTFYITKPDVENIFEHISMYFAEGLHPYRNHRHRMKVLPHHNPCP